MPPRNGRLAATDRGVPRRDVYRRPAVDVIAGAVPLIVAGLYLCLWVSVRRRADRREISERFRAHRDRS
jgi:hypothetical protein